MYFFALVPKKLYAKMFMSQTRISQPFPTPIANKKQAGGLTSTCNNYSTLKLQHFKNTLFIRFGVFE